MNSYKDFANEGAIYRHRTGYVSPISSRNYTYDLIEMAEEEKWEVTIHDCSNEVKFYRGCGPSGQFGHIDYETSMNLPRESYLYALDKYFEDDVKYEIF